MAHILANGIRNVADNSEDLVRLNEVPDQVQIDMTNYSVPNDAAYLKNFTPVYVTSNGAKAQFMWINREFEMQKNSETFPAYIVTGFGLLDAFIHAHATNATLVLHPLDIILSVCYAYGNDRMRPIIHNNEELKYHTQIGLKQDFSRSNLLLAIMARIARRVEQYPLPKLYSLINSEMSSPDPLVMRLVVGVLSYLASTKDTMKHTMDQFKNMFDLYKHPNADQLDSSRIPFRTCSLDVRHDPNAPKWQLLSSIKENNTGYQQVVAPQTTTKQEAGGTSVDLSSPSATPTGFSVRSVEPDKGGRRLANSQGPPSGATSATVFTAVEAAAAEAETEAAEAIATQTKEGAGPSDGETGTGGGTDDTRIFGDWRLMFEHDAAEGEVPQEAALVPSVKRTSAYRVRGQDHRRSTRSLDGKTGRKSKKSRNFSKNNSNFAEEQEAAEWLLKPRTPSRIYRFKKENGFHSVLFKGSPKAWLELPEILHELCQFFMLDSALQSKIIEIGQNMQKSRLNISRNTRRWWQRALFKDGNPTEPLPDGDCLINGWLALLLGDRHITEHCPMTINKLVDLKAGVKLPMLLVRHPSNSIDETDDAVLDMEDGLQMTRLHYYDEYREKLANGSSNANGLPVGLFMPWRSADALNRSKSLWQMKMGGDEPGISVVVGANNRSNVDNRAPFGSTPEKDQGNQEDETSVKLWTARRHGSAGAKSNICCCCGRRARRRMHDVTEPVYNMSCLITSLGGFCLQHPSEGATQTNRTCVRPLCFIEIVHED